MTIGPVQLLVLGFDKPDFHGEIADELQRLKDSDTVQLIDSLTVYKDAAGDVTVLQARNVSAEHAAEIGAVIGALTGLGAEGAEGAEKGAAAGADEMAERGMFSERDAWNVLDDIPDDSAAAILLLEHRWAIPLRDAIAGANGFRVADRFIGPLDLVAVGLVAAQDAAAVRW